MLNYIIPPIVIIISLSVLVIFFSRKAQQIPAQENSKEEGEKKPKRKISMVISAVGQFMLKILERLMHKFKLLSLKFHNISNSWFHSIHEKRQRKIIEQQETEKSQDIKENDKSKENIIQEKLPKNIQDEKPIRPLIREAVTNPQMENKEKSKLEEALIKRIAINPRDIEAYERLGDYYLESKNFRDSHECFKQVLMLSPSHYKAKIRIRKIEKMIIM
ncbi:MAG TPA: tetratricopeptide repeat protein [Candidatus Moranbacteria bacterium]|nr:tetratricopeptide repeat protein [Candidatus Moranbacteria bacterium]HRZ33684.1 tetratricopeptide repeat protein [Candidatus Moranbacteria bacterium]